MKKGWNVRANVVWDIQKNVPTFREDCWDCEVVELLMTDPGDARPAFDHDYEVFREALVNEFGADISKEILGNGIVLVNKGAGLDDFREFFARGTIVGKVYWEPVERRWRFRASYASAYVLLEKGLASTVEVNEIPKEGSTIFAQCKEGEQVILTKGGCPAGVGYCRKGRVRVVTSFPKELVCKDPFPAPDLPTTIEDMIKHNEKRLVRLVSQSKKFIYVMREKVRDRPLTVSFSGGKDSLVALHLTLQLEKPIIVFNNTGIEMPETIETVERVSKEWGLELVVADAGDDFWKAMMKNAPPARDLRWCCKVTKLVPMARLVKERWPNGTLNVVGQRALESIERSKSPRVWRNKWFPQVLNIAPIHYWTQLDVWMYIFKNKLTNVLNPLYFKGFERVGCFMCPASLLAEFEYTKRVHPELWSKWEERVEWWRKFIGLPPEWRDFALWRWLSPNNKKKSFMHKLKVQIDWKKEYQGHVLPHIEEKEVKDNFVKIKFKSNIQRAIEDQYSILGKDRKGNSIMTPNGHTITVDEREIAVKGDNALEEALVASALIHRWYQCMGCKSCEVWCPTGAIKVDERPKVNPDKCISCRLCVLECPIYEPVTDRVTSSLLLERPDGWRRKSKPLKKDVIKKVKEMVEDASALGGVTGA